MPPEAISDDIYDKVANSRASGGGNRIVDGAYTFLVKRLLLEKKHKGVIWFIAELRVVKADPVDVPGELRKASEVDKEIKPNREGADVSLLCDMSSDYGPGNCKAFLLGIDGTEESEVDPKQFAAMMKRTCSKAQPFRGALVKDTTYRKQIKSGPNVGKPFTGHNWENVKQTLDEIKARRAQLDASDTETPPHETPAD